MEFKIGQKITAIRNHSQGRFKKGDEFVILNIKKKMCNCTKVNVLIDVGHISHSEQVGSLVTCALGCRGSYIKEKTVWYFDTSFACLDFDISELTKILEQPIEYVEK